MDLYLKFSDNMWEINLQNQITTFLLSSALGIIICIVYDVVRAYRCAARSSKLSVFLGDVFLCVVSAFVTFIFLIARTNGEVRLYVLIGELLGFVLFRGLLSRVWYKLVFKFFSLVFNFNKMIFAFVTRIIQSSEKFFYNLFSFFSKKGALATKNIKKLLKNIKHMLYTDTNNVNSEDVVYETDSQT